MYQSLADAFHFLVAATIGEAAEHLAGDRDLGGQEPVDQQCGLCLPVRSHKVSTWANPVFNVQADYSPWISQLQQPALDEASDQQSGSVYF